MAVCYFLDDVRDVFAAIGGLLQFLDDFLMLDQGDGIDIGAEEFGNQGPFDR